MSFVVGIFKVRLTKYEFWEKYFFLQKNKKVVKYYPQRKLSYLSVRSDTKHFINY